MIRLPQAFAVTIPADGRRMYRSRDWDDTLVVVERGTLELVCHDGRRLWFRRGEPLFLAGLPLRALRSGHDTATTLLCVRHRGAAADGRG
ncbi:MAG TPA: hypothetical protein VD903_18370 [Pseudonocardia sp.]|nr:hypothetical protein [Pseudonocardia sp.]